MSIYTYMYILDVYIFLSSFIYTNMETVLSNVKDTLFYCRAGESGYWW